MMNVKLLNKTIRIINILTFKINTRRGLKKNPSRIINPRQILLFWIGPRNTAFANTEIILFNPTIILKKTLVQPDNSAVFIISAISAT